MQTHPATPDWDPEADGPGGTRGAGARSAARQGEYARLREECPVAYSERHGGHWTLTRYEDVRAASLDHKRFRSGQPFIAMPDFTQSIPIGMNPPEHAPYRRLLNEYFVLARMRELEPAVRSYVDEHLDDLLATGGGDFVAQFASPLPARVLCAFLHMPDSAWEDLVGHLKTLDSMRDDPQEVSQVIFGLFAGYVADLVERRRRDPLDPEQDLMSGVIAAEIDGRPLPDEVLIAIGVQVIAAGHSTTTDGLAGAAYRLATNPDIQARLRREPSLIPDAVEEFPAARGAPAGDGPHSGRGHRDARSHHPERVPGRAELRSREPRHVRVRASRRLHHRSEPESAPDLRSWRAQVRRGPARATRAARRPRAAAGPHHEH